ncbi:MAG: hypothetical protein HGB30_11965 [Holophagaceae bacterium]|nr:hypothetical protein [Holophagaceae bacterium]
MKLRLVLAALLLLGLGAGSWLVWQNGLEPVPLADARKLYVPAAPEFQEDLAKVAVLLPAGPGVEALLVTQSDLPLLEKGPNGVAGLLVAELSASRHGRRWRLTVRPGWRLQDGTTLDAARLLAAVAPQVASLGGKGRALDPTTVELRFKVRPASLPVDLLDWRVPGSGPFVRRGATLTRFDGFVLGRTGLAAITVTTDPALLQSDAWATGLSARRWAWAAFPGGMAPADMARARTAPYDELHLKGGTVWFLSRRLRRLRPDPTDWTRTRFFGAWQGTMDLPYDPLGM